MRVGTLFKGLAAIACSSFTLAEAACFNPAAPADSPTQGVEMFFDIHLDLPKTPELSDIGGRSLARGALGPAELLSYPYNPPDVLFNLYLLTDSYSPSADERPVNEGNRASLTGNWRQFNRRRSGAFGYGGPIYVWPNHIDPSKLDHKTLEPQGGTVYFYEPNGKGGRRVCRVEYWASRTLEVASHLAKLVPSAAPEMAPTSPAQTRNPELAKLGKQFFLLGYTNIEYDAQGRVPKIGPVCYFYRPDGQVRLVRFASEDGRCVDAAPDPTKERFVTPLFDASGKAYGAEINEPWEWRPEDDKTSNRMFRNGDTKGWKRFAVLYNEVLDEQISGLANDRSGTYAITAGGKTKGSFGIRDDNRYNQWRNRTENLPNPRETDFDYAEGSSRIYHFPYAVPADLIRHPERIYDYDRVRVTGIYAGLGLYERFKPGPNNIMARIWKTDGSDGTPRQEFFDNGRRVRALVVDFSSKDEHEALWDEDIDRYKNALKMPIENLYMRVYDYNADGKANLVAVGWTDFPRKKYYEQSATSKRATLRQTGDSLKRLIGMNVPKAPAELTYFFGTLDGKVKWSNQEAFLKWVTRDGKYKYQGRGSDLIFPDGDRTTGD